MLKGPLRHRWFAAFVGAIGLSGIGNEVSRLAMPLLVLDITHSLGAAAFLRVVQLIPYVFFGAVAGAVIDRVDKRRLLIGCDVANVVLVALVPLSVAAGLFSIQLLYVVNFLLGTVEVLWGVTSDFSVVPALVEEHELTTANATYLGADRAARVIGPVLGGVVIGAFGGGAAADATALWISVVAFAPTLLVVFLMPSLDADRAPSRPFTPANVAGEIAEGFGFLWRSPILRALLVLMFISNLGGQGINTLLLFVLSQEQHLDATTIGIALSFTGLITIAGSAFAPWLARGRPLGHTMLGVVAVAALGSVAAAFARDWRAIVAAVSVRQTAWAAHIVYAFLPRQREVPAALRGRANGSFRTVVLIANAASPALLSAIQAAAGSPAAFLAAGALGLAAVAVTYFSPLRHYAMRDVERRAGRAEPGVELEEAVGPLP